MLNPKNETNTKLLDMMQNGEISRDVFKFMKIIIRKKSHENGIVKCNQRDICEEFGATYATVKKVQDLAVDAGLIEVERGPRRMNEIKIKI